MATMTKAEKAIHLESAPRSFVGRKLDGRSHAVAHDILVTAEQLTKADAVRVAQTLLVHVYADGIGYEDFQSAQACERYIGQAIRALRGLSLS